MDCGKYIRAARIAVGLTQAELAAKCDMATITIRQYESGKRQPRYEQLELLADALDVPLEVLLGIGESVRGESVAIAAHVIEKAGLTVKDRGGNVIHQGNGRRWQRMSDAAAYRAGFIQFHSEEDRIIYFYQKLTDEGRIAAGGCFFQHLDKGALSKVADYVMSLSENPLYQRPATTESTPAPSEGKDTAPDKKLSETP